MLKSQDLFPIFDYKAQTWHQTPFPQNAVFLMVKVIGKGSWQAPPLFGARIYPLL